MVEGWDFKRSDVFGSTAWRRDREEGLKAFLGVSKLETVCEWVWCSLCKIAYPRASCQNAYLEAYEQYTICYDEAWEAYSSDYRTSRDALREKYNEAQRKYDIYEEVRHEKNSKAYDGMILWTRLSEARENLNKFFEAHQSPSCLTDRAAETARDKYDSRFEGDNQMFCLTPECPGNFWAWDKARDFSVFKEKTPVSPQAGKQYDLGIEPD